MAIRVPEFSDLKQFLRYNGRARNDQAAALERLSTLKKVNRGSDEPEHYLRIKNARADLSQTAAFQDTVKSALAKQSVIEGALDGIRESLTRARELTIQGSSFLYDDLERETIADQIQQMRLDIFNRLNTQYEGRYLFSGTAIDTRPFQDPTTGAYSGNTELTRIRIAPGDSVIDNFHGEEIAFGPGGQGSADDILDALQDLETAFRNNDTVAINAELPRLRPALQRLNGQIAELGARGLRLVSAQTYYDEFEESLRATLVELEDADLAEEAVNLETTQARIDAQLRAQGSVNRQTLLDFLG